MTRLPDCTRIAWLTLLALSVCFLPEAAAAADNIFGSDSPLTTFIDFLLGPFAYGVVIVSLVVTVGMLVIGAEFSGFARRMPIIVVAGGIVILADTVLGNLFGGSRAASLPPTAEITEPPPELFIAGNDGLSPDKEVHAQ